MAKYKIEHDRPNCIGCGACAAVFDTNWFMEEDGKSNLKNHDVAEGGEYDGNKNAADSCPVNVIHIINTETGEKII